MGVRGVHNALVCLRRMPRDPRRTTSAVERAILGDLGAGLDTSPGSARPAMVRPERIQLLAEPEPEPEPELEPEPDLALRSALDAQTRDDVVLRHDEMLTAAQERDRIRAVLAQTQADAARMLKEQKDRHARVVAEEQFQTAEELASLENARAAAEAQVRMAIQAQALLKRLDEQPTELSAWGPPITVQPPSSEGLLYEAGREELQLYSESYPEQELWPELDGVYAKLTDVTQFTGHHKHRFDQQTGQGLGYVGLGIKVDVEVVDKHHEYVELLKEAKHQQRMKDLQDRADRMQQWALDKRWQEEEQMVELFEKRRAQEERAARAHERRVAAAQRKAAENAAMRELQESYAMTDADQWPSPVSEVRKIPEGVPWHGSPKPIRLHRSNGASSGTSRGVHSGPSIFDKLTDHTQFTGAHKARFDANGRGRGKIGRSESPRANQRASTRKPKATSPPTGRQQRRKAAPDGKRGSRNSSSTGSEASDLSSASAGVRSTSQNEDTTPGSGRASIASADAAVVQSVQPDAEEEHQDEESTDGEDPVDFLIARRHRAQSIERGTGARDDIEAAAASHRVAANNLRALAARVERDGDAAGAAQKMAEGIAQLEAALAAVQPTSTGTAAGTFV